jgi:hypothetical protein
MGQTLIPIGEVGPIGVTLVTQCYVAMIWIQMQLVMTFDYKYLHKGMRKQPKMY